MSTSLQTNLIEFPAIGLKTDANPSLRHILVAGDAASFALAWTVALLSGTWLRGELAEGFPDAALAVMGLFPIVLSMLALMAMQRLYLARVCSVRTVEMARIGRISLIAAISALLLARFVGEPHLARIPLLVGGLTFVALNAWRSFYAAWLANARKRDNFTRSVIIVGADHEAHSLYKHISNHPELGYRFYGFVGSPKDAADVDWDLAWLGDTDKLRRIVEETGIKGAFVVGGALGSTQLNAVLRRLLDSQVHVHLSTGVNGIGHRRMRSHSVAYEPLVYVERADLETWQLAMKRVLDISIASAVLLLSTPLLLATAIAMRIEGKGPILFKQRRVGHNGELFTIYKLRSMVIDAEQKLDLLQAENARTGPLFKLAIDPRVTRLGKVLRATSIDELPQLWNVIRGEMSLVGPRPALPSEVAQFDARLMARQNVKPGITGLWQVEGRDNPDFSLYQRLDLFYVENWSVALDLAILTGTAKVVVARGFQSFGRFQRRRAAVATADPATVRELVLN